MTRRAAITIATALLAFTAVAAAVAARQRQARPVSPPSYSWVGADLTVLNVYPGPLPVSLVGRVISWWNRAGADVRLRLTADQDKANVIIRPNAVLPHNIVGKTTTSCHTLPCRPDLWPETITLSSGHPYARAFVLAHELGHAMGLAHSHVKSCSIMAPEEGLHCPSDQLPSEIPSVDRRPC